MDATIQKKAVKLIDSKKPVVEHLQERYKKIVKFLKKPEQRKLIKSDRALIVNAVNELHRKLGTLLATNRKIVDQYKLRDYKDEGIPGVSNLVNFSFENPDILNVAQFSNYNYRYLEAARMAFVMLDSSDENERDLFDISAEDEADYYKTLGEKVRDKLLEIPPIDNINAATNSTTFWQLFTVLVESFAQPTGNIDINILRSFQEVTGGKYLTGMRKKQQGQKGGEQKKGNTQRKQQGNSQKKQQQQQQQKKKGPQLSVYEKTLGKLTIGGATLKKYLDNFWRIKIRKLNTDNPQGIQQFIQSLIDDEPAELPDSFGGSMPPYVRSNFIGPNDKKNIINKFKKSFALAIIKFSFDDKKNSSVMWNGDNQVSGDQVEGLFKEISRKGGDFEALLKEVRESGKKNPDDIVRNILFKKKKDKGKNSKESGKEAGWISIDKLEKELFKDSFIFIEKDRVMNHNIDKFIDEYKVAEINYFSDSTFMDQKQFREYREEILLYYIGLTGLLAKITYNTIAELSETFSIQPHELKKISNSGPVAAPVSGNANEGYTLLKDEDKKKVDQILARIQELEQEDNPQDKPKIAEWKEKIRQMLEKRSLEHREKKAANKAKKAAAAEAKKKSSENKKKNKRNNKNRNNRSRN